MRVKYTPEQLRSLVEKQNANSEQKISGVYKDYHDLYTRVYGNSKGWCRDLFGISLISLVSRIETFEKLLGIPSKYDSIYKHIMLYCK